jgi:hypothetical protein
MRSSDVIPAYVSSRIMANFIDLLIDLGPITILMTVGMKTGDLTSGTGDSDQDTTAGNWMVGVGLGLLFGAIIYQLYREGRTGQSIGKRIVGIKTVSAMDPRRPLGFAILRRPNLVDSIIIEVTAEERQPPGGPPSSRP